MQNVDFGIPCSCCSQNVGDSGSRCFGEIGSEEHPIEKKLSARAAGPRTHGENWTGDICD